MVIARRVGESGETVQVNLCVKLRVQGGDTVQVNLCVKPMVQGGETVQVNLGIMLRVGYSAEGWWNRRDSAGEPLCKPKGSGMVRHCR